MKGFIFAAGYGERLRPVTDSIPKALAPVMNVPAIVYSVMLLKEAGITDVICNLHHRGDDIVRFFGENDNFGLSMAFSHEDTILGTGGGLKKCEDLIGEEDFVLLNSDVLMDIDLNRVIALHRSLSSPATVVLRPSGPAPAEPPVAVVEDRVVDFRNFLGTDRPGGRIYAGAAVLSPMIFRYLREEFTSIVYTGYVDIIRNGVLRFYDHGGFWHDIGTPESLWDANMRLLGGMPILDDRLSSAAGRRMQAVSPGNRVEEGAAVTRSVIGRDCLVGKGAVVEDSLLLSGSSVAPGGVIRNSIVCGNDIIPVKKKAG